MEHHETTDVCIIGLGAAGGIFAAELAAAGLRVVGLEAGPYLPRETFESEDHQDELAHFKLGRLRWNEPEVLVYNGGAPATFPVISRNIGVGGPLHWSCISYRFHESDFRVKSESGMPPGTSVDDWPLSYEELEPYYDRAEQVFGVAGEAGSNRFEAFRSRPYPLPPLPARPASRRFAEAASGSAYGPFPVPAAITTLPHYGGKEFRNICNTCGRCTFYGCSQHAKGVNLVVTLPDALTSGALEVRAECTATEITVDKNGRADAVVYRDREGHVHQQPARVVIASNNAAYVARLLLMSRSDRFPAGLANSSGLVGKNLTFHASTFGYGTFPDSVFKVGLDPQAAVAFDDLNEDRPRENEDQPFIRGAVISGGIALPFTGGPLAFATSVGTFIPLPPGIARWGGSFKQFLYQCYNRYFAVFSLCEDLPLEDNRVELDPALCDRFGLPALRIIYRDSENTVLMQTFMRRKIEELLRFAGARDIVTTIPAMPGGAAAGHVMGTTRMGDDPARSVVNRYCQAHEIPNLFIGGSGPFVTSAGLNPTLTIFALAYRTADFIRNRWREGAFEADA